MLFSIVRHAIEGIFGYFFR